MAFPRSYRSAATQLAVPPAAKGSGLVRSGAALISSSDRVDRGHYPQLDGLRALAVSAVFAGHFLSDTWLAKAVGWGDAGVILFFCLSGYLITDILLEIDAPSAADRRAGVGIFYVRR